MFFRKVQGGGGGIRYNFFHHDIKTIFFTTLNKYPYYYTKYMRMKTYLFFGGKEKDSITNI